MWKRLRVPLLVVVAASLVALLFSWQLKFLYVPVRVGLEKLTGQPVTFAKIEYRLFNRVTIQDLTVGSTFRSKTITVYFNPLQLITALAAPQHALFRIHFASPCIAVTPELSKIIEHIRSTAPDLGNSSPKNDLKISWVDAVVSSGEHRVDRLSGQTIVTRDTVTGRMTGKFAEELISLAFYVQSTNEGSSRIRAEAKMNGSYSDLNIVVDGTRAPSGTITAAINAPKLAWKGYSLNEVSGTIRCSDLGIEGAFTSNAATVVVKGSDTAHVSAWADINLTALIPGTTGSIHLTAVTDNGSVAGTALSRSLAFRGQPLGDIALSFKNDPANSWNIDCAFDPAKCRLSAVVKDGNTVDAVLFGEKKEIGKITGTLSPLNFSFMIEEWPAVNLPVICTRFPGVKGSLAINGTVGRSAGDITVTAAKWQIPGTVPLSGVFHIIGRDDNWFLKADTDIKDVRMSAKYLNTKDWEAAVEFRNTILERYLSWTSLPIPVKGWLTGTAFYSSKQKGALGLQIRKLSLNGSTFDNARLTASLEKESIKVKELSVHSGKGTLTAFAELFLDAASGDSKASIRFHQFPLNNRTMHGSIDIKGTLSQKEGWKFAGSCQTGKMQYDRWVVQKIRSFISITADRVDLKGLQVDSILNGNLSLLYRQNTVDCALLLQRLPLSMLRTGLQGHVSGNAVIKGNIKNPDAVLNVTAGDARYNNTAFSFRGKFVHKNNEVYCSDASVSSGDSRVTASGRLLPALAVTTSVKDFSTVVAEQFLKTSLPLHGLFSGTADIRGTFAAPVITAEIAGKSLTLDSMPLSECKARFSASKDAVTLASMSLKFSDSELKLHPESIIDLKKKTFALNTEWRNVHAGPADLFGMLLFNGTWNREGNDSAVHGIITTTNFWLNEHVLDKETVAVSFRNHVLTFLPQGDKQLKIEGAIDFKSWPELCFKQWQIRQGNRSLSLDGILGEKRWDFSAVGRLVKSETLSELLNLSFGLEGDIDFSILGKGSIDHPQIEGSVTASNGSIANFPFDSVNLQIGAHQDVMTVTSARLVKKGQYAVIATGYIPFFLNEAGRKRVLNRPLDLTVTVEEGTLSLLKGISSDILSAAGNLRAQARISGTLAKPVGNGFLHVSNGVITAKRYFSKLSNLNVDLLWKDNLLTIKDFSGRIGDGRVRMKGGLVLQGLSVKTVNVALYSDGSKGVPVFVPELPIPSPLIKKDEWQLFSNSSHGDPRFNVQLSGPEGNMLLSGWVELENVHFSYPPPASSETAEGDVPLDAIWPRISWDLELRSGKNTWYDNDLVHVNIMGGIRLSGKGASPSVDGKVESLRGTITYLGREFTIKQALLEINHDNVFIEGEAETEVNGTNSTDSDVIRMYIDKAKIENLKPRFVSKSDPDMTQEKALAKATGVDPETYSNVDRDFIMRQQLIRLIDSTLATPLARNLLSRSGIADSFRVRYLNQEPIKPAIPGSPTLTELLYGTKYSVEKHLTNQILFGYSVTFDQAQNRLDLRHELELSYRLQKNTFLTGSYELESKYNTLRQPDRRIIVEQQWRFGWTPKKKQR